MKPNRRWVIAAAVAMIVSASPARAALLIGKGSVGGSVGVPFFVADQDTKEGQKPRLLGQLQFQYVFSNDMRLALKTGYGWVGYDSDSPSPYPLPRSEGGTTDTKVDLLTNFQPVTATLIHPLDLIGEGWTPYVGAGVGLYRLNIVNQRKTIFDPATFDRWRKWSFGLNAAAGVEYFLPSNQNVALTWEAQGHYLFSKDTEQFPSGFTDNDALVNLSFGVNVYFWPVGHKPLTPTEGSSSTTPPVPEPASISSEPAPSPSPSTPDTIPAPADTIPAPADTIPAPTDTIPSLPDTATSVPDTARADTTAPDTSYAPSEESSPLPPFFAPPAGEGGGGQEPWNRPEPISAATRAGYVEPPFRRRC